MTSLETEEWINRVDTLSEQGYVVVDDFLPPALYHKTRSFFMQKMEEEAFHRAGLGSVFNNQIDTSIRGDFTYWLDRARDEELSDLFGVISETISVFNQYCFLCLSGYEFHLAHYPAGTFYKRHLDQFKDSNNRMISVIIYLNEGWKDGDGGELRIFEPDKETLVQPYANRCVMFKNAEIPHEVTLTNVSRYSLTGWLLYQPSGVGYMLG
ncbi:MAG: 2OG-Fe(II) oxygenase family protein [Ekhidna sp.]